MVGLRAGRAGLAHVVAAVALVLLVGASAACGSAQPSATIEGAVIEGAVEVPGVIGLSPEDATAAVEDAGLRAERREAQAAESLVGSVVAQTPEQGTRVTPGSTVLLVVGVPVPVSGSPSTAQVAVPEVRGMTQADATAALGAAGLVGVPKTVPSGQAPKGEVIGQDPAPGTKVAQGSTVAIEVAGEEAAATNPIAWVLGLGPTAPQGPPEFRAYAMLLKPATCPDLAAAIKAGDLAGLSDEAIRLYQATADACLAAFHGKKSLWAKAQKALKSLDKPASCIDAAAYGLLQRLVSKHKANEAGKFKLTKRSSYKAPPCPGNATVEPGSGLMGTIVTVKADNLPRVVDMRVLFLRNGSLEDTGGLQFLERTDRSIKVSFSDSTPAEWACLVLQAAAGWDAAGAWFAIDPSDPATKPQQACPPPPQ